MTQLSNTNGILDSFQGHTLWSNITLTICTICTFHTGNLYISRDLKRLRLHERQSVVLGRWSAGAALSPAQAEWEEERGRAGGASSVVWRANRIQVGVSLVRNIPLSEVPNRENPPVKNIKEESTSRKKREIHVASSKQSASCHVSSDQLVIKLHFSLQLKFKRFRSRGLDQSRCIVLWHIGTEN